MDFHVELANGKKISFNEVLSLYKKYITFEFVVESNPLKIHRYFGYCTDISLSVANPHYCSININLPHFKITEKSFTFNLITSIQAVDVTEHDDSFKKE